MADEPKAIDPIWIEIAGVVGRWIAVLVCGALVARHILTSEQDERLVTAIAHDAALWFPAGVSLFWSLRKRFQNWRARHDPAFNRRKDVPASTA